MRVRTVIATLLLYLMSVTTVAQTQKGFVKTKGRMVNGKHVPGQGLAGAVVTVKGQNAVSVQQANGSFLFPTTNRQFFIQSVTKNGYALVDADAAPKAYTWSANPIILLLETPQQQAEDRLQAERKIRRTLQRQLQQREDEIEELKSQNKLSQEEYQKALQQLYEDQKNNEKLIAEMAKEYSQMDYDQMDSLNQRISDCILNGELTRADSLLRTKGDINSRIAQLQREQQAEAKEREELAKRQEDLAVSEEGTKRKLEDIANDCKQYYERFELVNQHDSALYYLELRASLDTTNAEWQLRAGVYNRTCHNDNKAMRYYDRVIKLWYAKKTPVSATIFAWTINEMADLGIEMQEYQIAEKLLNWLLDLYQKTYDEERKDENFTNDDFYNILIVRSLRSRGKLYAQMNRYEESERDYKSALEISRKWSIDNPKFEYQVQRNLNSLAGIYQKTNRLNEAEQAYMEVLRLKRRLANENSRFEESMLASTISTLAGFYSSNKRYSEAETLYKEALEIKQRLATTNPQRYELSLAKTLYLLACLYRDTQRYAEGLQTCKEAMEIYRSSAKKKVEYREGYESSLELLSYLYFKNCQQTEAYETSRRLIHILKQEYDRKPEEFRDRSSLALRNYTLYCIYTGHLIEAEHYGRQAIIVDSLKPKAAINLSYALLFQGKYSEAEQVFRQYKSQHKDDILDDFRQFAEAGVIPKEREADVERIKRMLEE